MIETEGGEITFPEEKSRYVNARGIKPPTPTRQTRIMLIDVQRMLALAIVALETNSTSRIDRHDEARVLVTHCLGKLENGWHPYDTFLFARYRETKIAVARAALRGALNRINEAEAMTIILIRRAYNAVQAIERSIK